jgi:hypothetical protein
VPKPYSSRSMYGVPTKLVDADLVASHVWPLLSAVLAASIDAVCSSQSARSLFDPIDLALDAWLRV